MNEPLSCRVACRVTGHGSTRVLLLHALTGGPDAADRPGVKGWWGPLFAEGAPLAADRAKVWTPNLPGSCYGTEVTKEQSSLGTRQQAALLAEWIQIHDLHFEALLGGSLGGMVALELALQAPDRFGALGVIGCGARADAWQWGTNEIQRAILRTPDLSDETAIALARRAAMLTFRTPDALNARFGDADALRSWLAYHGAALAGRFTRSSYLALLDAMDAHDIGQGRGGLVKALERLKVPVHVLGMDPDYLFPRPVVEELVEAARQAERLGSSTWIEGPHGHDAFLIEWASVRSWLTRLLAGGAP